MKLSAGDRRRISGNASTDPGASQIVIIMKMQVSDVTCHRFRDMRYATRTRLKKHYSLKFTAWCPDVLADKPHPRFDAELLNKKVWLIRRRLR